MPAYYAYLLECADGTLYAGSTNDINRRETEHNTSPKGAKYTRARRPVVMRYHETFASLGEAAKREAQLKRLTRSQKLELVSSQA
ncbi:MAG: GIY-YIG nuclease family protein [Patescibacteria group bacterium]